jgi:hypothetical protein
MKRTLISLQFSVAILVALGLLSFAAISQATIITWTVGDITAPTDVITNGSLVSAVRIGTSAYPGPATQPVVVNGVSFTASGVPASPISAGGFNLAYAGYNSFNSDAYSAFADASLADLMSQDVNMQWYDGATNLTITGLTIGRDYKLQVFSFDNGGWTDGHGSFLQLAATGGDTGTGQATNSQYLVGSFTAGSTSLTLDWSTWGNPFAPPGPYRADINALQLRDVTAAVPEPSTVLLFGLGGMMILWRRRRSAKPA